MRVTMCFWETIMYPERMHMEEYGIGFNTTLQDRGTLSRVNDTLVRKAVKMRHLQI